MANKTDISLEEIDRWIDSISDHASDIASRAYTNAKMAHVTGERPKYLRGEWHNLPADYREFLVSIARLAMKHPTT